MWRILNMADLTPCPAVFRPLDGLAEVVTVPADQTVLRQRLPEFDGYFAGLSVRLDQACLEQAKRLRVIATPTTGLDHLDGDFALSNGVDILCLKYETAFLASVTATAEMGWALLLAVVRKLPWSFAAAQQGIWARDRFRGHQLAGKTLGILGYGRLGKIMAEYGHGFRMRVIACDVCDVTPAPNVTMVDFQALLREADVLSVHIHLTEENRGLINAPALAAMKPGAIVINTSRGAIVDEPALLDALQRGHLGGAGLDVIHGEWSPDLQNHPLIRYARDHENVVISPHTGGLTYESQAMTCEFMVNKLKRYLEQADPAARPAGRQGRLT